MRPKIVAAQEDISISRSIFSCLLMNDKRQMLQYIVEIDSEALRIISPAKGGTKSEIPIATIHPKVIRVNLMREEPRPNPEEDSMKKVR